MPCTAALRTAQCSRLIPLSVSPTSDESGKQSLYPDGDPDRHQNRLFIGPLPTFPENFMQIRSGSFCAKLLTDRRINKCVCRLARRKSHHTRPKLRLPTEPRRRCQQMICRTRLVFERSFAKQCRPRDCTRAKVRQNGRRPVRIVVKHACKISRPYLFPPQRNP